jgi:hypothetical protein
MHPSAEKACSRSMQPDALSPLVVTRNSCGTCSANRTRVSSDWTLVTAARTDARTDSSPNGSVRCNLSLSGIGSVAARFGRPRSAAACSAGLLIPRSQVRVLPGPLDFRQQGFLSSCVVYLGTVRKRARKIGFSSARLASVPRRLLQLGPSHFFVPSSVRLARESRAPDRVRRSRCASLSSIDRARRRSLV